MLKSLNDITEEDFKLITDLAGLFFTPKKISVMIELKVEDMKNAMLDEDGDVYRAFYSGRLQKEIELRRSILKLANVGSSPAQTMGMDMYNKSSIEMLDL